jgi:superfamily II RNA helicase
MRSGSFGSEKADGSAVNLIVAFAWVQQEVTLVRALARPLEQLQETAQAIGEIQAEAKLPVDAGEFAESFKPYLMDVIYQWSKVGGPALLTAPNLQTWACHLDCGSAALLSM